MMNAIQSLPQVIIEADGARIDAEDAIALSSVYVRAALSLPALCALTFTDPPGPLDVIDRLQPGVALRVTVSGQDAPLFDGDITAVEYAYGPANERSVHVRGYDKLHQLAKSQHVRAYVDLTLADLAREMTKEAGLSVIADEGGPRWGHLIQDGRTDLSFLAALAERAGFYLAVREDVLHLLTLAGDGAAPVPLELGETLFDARVEINADPAFGAVTGRGWDPLKVEAYTGEAGQARSGRAVDAGGLLEAALQLPDELAPDAAHAEALAQAELDRRAAREVAFRGTAEGDTRLRPGAVVEIAGVAADFAGRYVLADVTHQIDREAAFISSLSTTPAAPREADRGVIATFGTVTQIDDPEVLGRVKVALPTFGDVETDWMGVLTVGAGADKGLMFTPDVGDLVLVLCPHADPARGIVLGGLYGMDAHPDPGVEDGAVKRFTLRTPGGQVLKLDDTGQIIRFDNSDGSFVELAPGTVKLHSNVDLEIEAPGQAVVIRGSTIDFQQG